MAVAEVEAHTPRFAGVSRVPLPAPSLPTSLSELLRALRASDLTKNLLEIPEEHLRGWAKSRAPG